MAGDDTFVSQPDYPAAVVSALRGDPAPLLRQKRRAVAQQKGSPSSPHRAPPPTRPRSAKRSGSPGHGTPRPPSVTRRPSAPRRRWTPRWRRPSTPALWCAATSCGSAAAGRQPQRARRRSPARCRTCRCSCSPRRTRSGFSLESAPGGPRRGSRAQSSSRRQVAISSSSDSRSAIAPSARACASSPGSACRTAAAEVPRLVLPAAPAPESLSRPRTRARRPGAARAIAASLRRDVRRPRRQLLRRRAPEHRGGQLRRPV